MTSSSFDIRQAEGIKVPAGYGSHFKSFDGKARKFVAESNGGPSWFTEYNVLAGLSSRSFGRFSYFVTRIASGRVERGLPLALRRCGYNTSSLYPAYGAFMSARSFQTTTGIQHFYDARDLGAKDVEPDSFFYDKALKLMSEQPANTPLFTFVYLAANHFPWETRFRPDLMPSWRKPGNEPVVDEYLRRQAMSAEDYAAFIAGLKKKFPAQPFLIVRYGDHQPEFSPHLLDPGLDEAGIGKKLENYDPRYYATYYAIDAVNFEPVKSPAVMDTIDAAYLPLVIQEAAGIPLDPSFEEQKNIMLRCKGVFYACKDGAEARRFNRLLIDAGMIKGLEFRPCEHAKSIALQTEFRRVGKGALAPCPPSQHPSGLVGTLRFAPPYDLLPVTDLLPQPARHRIRRRRRVVAGRAQIGRAHRGDVDLAEQRLQRRPQGLIVRRVSAPAARSRHKAGSRVWWSSSTTRSYFAISPSLV